MTSSHQRQLNNIVFNIRQLVTHKFKREPKWSWFAGTYGDVEYEGLYEIGPFDTKEQAIAEGKRRWPRPPGGLFYIVEAQHESTGEKERTHRFISTRNHDEIF